MREWFGAPTRGGFEDLRYLPMQRARWRARRAVFALGVALASAGALAALRSPTASDAAGPLLIVALIAYLARVQRTRGVLLRLALSPHRSVGDGVGAVEELLGRARSNASLHARVVAVLADLELGRGERPRGLRLFYGLHARGWTPTRLLEGRSEGAGGLVGRAAATMATLEAIEGLASEAESVLEPLRARGLEGPALTLDAVLRLRRGDFRGAAGALAPAVAEPRTRGRDVELHRLLYSYACHRVGEAPYRLAASSDEPSGPSGPSRAPWLAEHWPPLRAFVGRTVT